MLDQPTDRATYNVSREERKYNCDIGKVETRANGNK